ncbi:response regulator [Winogradskyella ouciana]|uniref:response regulator n=1 Tax=Winogradskyella ouciana TaxID=2608631 RepID=UPI003D2716A6
MISNVMLIDDNKIDLFICKKIIEKYDPEIKTRNFTNGISALNYLKLCRLSSKSKTLVPPDLILLDINMPQMNGFEFIEELKKQELYLAQLPKIYMLSSSLYPEDILNSDNNPYCSGYLNKPLTVEGFSSICNTASNSKRFRGSYLKLI